VQLVKIKDITNKLLGGPLFPDTMHRKSSTNQQLS